MLATTKIAMNSASPPNDAVTAISVVRACWSSGYSALPRASPVSTAAPPLGGAQARGVEAGGGEHADRVDPPGMTGQARRLGVGQEDRRLLPDGVARPGDADHGDGAGGFGGREAQLRAERGAVAGDDLAGPGGRASGAQHVGRQRGAAPAVGDGGAAAEAGRRRHVGDRRADAGDGRQPSGERGVHAGALAERDVVVRADDLLPGHDGRGAGVALDGRMGAQRRLERHAAGHHERGRGDQRHQGAGERAEAAAGAEEGETQHGSAPQVRELLGDLVGAGRVEHPGDPPVGEEDDAVGVRRRRRGRG